MCRRSQSSGGALLAKWNQGHFVIPTEIRTGFLRRGNPKSRTQCGTNGVEGSEGTPLPTPLGARAKPRRRGMAGGVRAHARGTQRRGRWLCGRRRDRPDRRLPARSQWLWCASHGAFRSLVRTQETLLAFPGHVTWIYRRWHRGGSVQRALGPFGTPKTPGLLTRWLTRRRPGPAPPLASRLLSPIALQSH